MRLFPPSEGDGFGFVPPQDIEAEMAVLGAMMLGEASTADDALTLLSPADFYREVHGEIFAAMRGLRDKREPVDAVTLQAELSRRKIYEQCGGVAYLMTLGDFTPTTANLPHYAALVKDASLKRQLQAFCMSAYRRVHTEPDTPAAELLEDAEQAVLALRPVEGQKSARFLREWMAEETTAIEERGFNAGALTGLSTGFFGLDHMLAGLQPSDLLILAARPSVGKTALAVDIMRSVVKSGAAVFFASLEMSGNQQAQRTLAAEGRVDANALRTGRMSEEDWRAITAAQERLHDGICIVDDDANQTPGSLGAACRRMKQKHALDLVIVDYLQLMNGGGGRRYENRNVEVSYISRSLKLLAKELGAPVLALSQLSRDIDKRADPRPQLSDLRDSGSLEQDADVVMFLHRELTEQEEKDLPKDAPVPTIVSVRKQRMGPTGDVKLGFVRRFARYDNWMEREQR